MNVSRILLVEGRDDQHVIYHLCDAHNLKQNFVVKDGSGVENLLKVLPLELKGSDVLTVGVVIDADLSIDVRWQSIRNILIGAGYDAVPTYPQAGGTRIVQRGLPTVGIWLMPNNVAAGMLEDFVAFLVPPDDPLYEKAKACVEGIPDEHRKFIDDHGSKAIIHTWLAWQKDPGTPLGLAITKKYLNPDVAEAASFVNWMSCLFSENEFEN